MSCRNRKLVRQERDPGVWGALGTVRLGNGWHQTAVQGLVGQSEKFGFYP